MRGLEHKIKLDEMFRDVTTTGARAWESTSGTVPSLYPQSISISDDDGVAKIGEHSDGDHEKIWCSIHEDNAVEPSRKQINKGKKSTCNFKIVQTT